MSALLSKVKENLIIEHNADDTLIESSITAAVAYAESYQHIPEGYEGIPHRLELGSQQESALFRYAPPDDGKE